MFKTNDYLSEVIDTVDDPIGTTRITSFVILSKQGDEPRLLEISVIGKRLAYVPLLHDQKACAVREGSISGHFGRPNVPQQP